MLFYLSTFTASDADADAGAVAIAISVVIFIAVFYCPQTGWLNVDAIDSLSLF